VTDDYGAGVRALGTSRLEAVATRVAKRLRSEAGFGLIELLVAMTVTMIAVMGLVAALTSAHVTVIRASRTSTAAAIASAQMERYRAVEYTEIGISVPASDSTYTGDSAYPGTAVTLTTTECPSSDMICQGTQSVTGADGRTYRLDTYIRAETPTSGRQVKKITVVVRDGTTTRVRESSVFDEATGS
jgi:Tfp pilus assembly protein PilV